MTRKGLVAAALFVAVALATSTGYASPRTDTHSYIGGTGNAGILSDVTFDGDTTQIGLGGAIIAAQSDDLQAAITLADDNTDGEVAGFYYFRGGGGARLSPTAFFCGAVDAGVPSGAVDIVIGIDTIAGLVGCGLGTTGTITVVWS